MTEKREEMTLSRRQFLDKGAKGAVVAAYVAPVILTVSLNSPVQAEDGKKDKKDKKDKRPNRGRGKGHDVSEVEGKGKGKGDDRDDRGR